VLKSWEQLGAKLLALWPRSAAALQESVERTLPRLDLDLYALADSARP